ncbi:MAG: glycosyltransferase family 1 protein [Pedobacter sp.]|nr:MAG: glycosyltransferase family 1 protein [Pedobacter sp.]
MGAIRGRDIIVVGLQPWDTEIGSNCKNIALEFSKYNRVLYVNSPLDRVTKMKHAAAAPIKKRLEILKHPEHNIEQIQENLWVYYPDTILESINWIKIRAIFNVINKRNNRLFADAIKRAVSKLNFKDFILFNDNDIFRSFYLKDLLKPAVSVYYSRDYLLGVDYWKYHGTKLEPELMAKSDVCVANSSYLADICRSYNPKSFDVGQGCELELFLAADLARIPEDVLPIQKPIIGYVGALQSLRLDMNVIKHVALERPDWNVVLVGPEDEDFKNSDLHTFKNIHFLGSKNPGELPAYIKSFDVCINPQILNEVTIGNYPRKIDEYLAVGKPVVATKTPAMRMFDAYCGLAETPEEYVKFIQIAIDTDSPTLAAQRIAFASQHTWENSVEKIYDSILIF